MRASITKAQRAYEIGTGGPKGGSIEWHYVGETKNERRRMWQCGSDGSHLSEMINWHLNYGWHIWYHACARPSKEAGKRMQDNLLKMWEYDCNHIGNR